MTKEPSKSSFVVQYSMNPIRNWYFNSGIILDSKYRDLQQANANIDYRFSEDKSVQMNYRYKASEDTTQVIQQTGTRILWGLSEHISVAGSHYYDLNIKRPVESIIGLQYTSCCWGVGVNYGSYLKSEIDTITNKLKPYGTKENKVGLYFFIPNIGTKKSHVYKLLKRSVYSYRNSVYSIK